MKNASWMMGLFAIAMMVLVACGVEQETPGEGNAVNAVNAVNAREESAQTEAPQSDVRISALAGDAESEADVGTLEACTPGTPGQWCCPYAGGCSCLGYRVCNPSGQWSVCRGAGAAGQPCP